MLSFILRKSDLLSVLSHDSPMTDKLLKSIDGEFSKNSSQFFKFVVHKLKCLDFNHTFSF